MKNNLKLTELCKKEMSRIIGGKPAHCGCSCSCYCPEGTNTTDTGISEGGDMRNTTQGSPSQKD